MPEILKLNEISPVADAEFPAGYVFTKDSKKPDGIMLRSFNMHEYPLNDELLAVARAGAGTNNIPIPACTEKGIVVFNTPGANANAVKELVLCELFLGGRKIVDGANWAQTLKGQENISKLVEKGKGKFVGQEILGKKLGVIGLGAIGAMVANAAIRLGMSVVGYDPFISVKSAWMIDRRVEFTDDLSVIFKTCDFITVHVPLTPDTKGMFNKDTLASCKDGVVIINNSRGDLVVSEDIVEAVAGGKVSRYITDFPDETLLGKENILCVPHLGASTPEAEDNCAYMAAKQLTDYLENGNIKNSVNLPTLVQEWSGVSRLCIIHRNIPGAIANITGLLSRDGVNVENMTNKSKKDYAYTVVDLGSRITDTVANEIRALEGVFRVRVLNH